MKKGMIALLTAICLLLSGCAGLFGGEYVYTQPHEIIGSSSESVAVHAENYWQLYHALEDMITEGIPQGIIFVSRYDKSKVQSDAKKAAEELKEKNPIAAYAVSNVKVELGTSAGEVALAVEISYFHDRAEIQRIKSVDSVDAAALRIKSAASACETGIVLKVNNYYDVDFVQIVEDHAAVFPEYVIEQPAVSVNVYPDSGTTRVVEVKFTYRTSRDTLKEMQTRVRTMFTSASLYVSADTRDDDKLLHLYSFIMERFEYVIATSITPAYSLLLHGVGDQRAFAMVYAAMCAREKIECYMVTGTRDGEATYWNIVNLDGRFYHVDLLRCSENGEFVLRLDSDMAGYVWDYDAYPPCVAPAESQTK